MSLNNVTADNAADFDFALSDGTPVFFVKVTSRDRIQVQIPKTHYLADEDSLRIFDRNGNHYRDDTDGITLTATPKAKVDTDPSFKVIVIDGFAYQLLPISPVYTAA